MINPSNLGVVFYLTSLLSYAIEFVVIHWVGGNVATPVLILFDNTGNILLLTTLVIVNGGITIRSKCYTAQFARVALGSARFWALVYSFTHLPLVDATALMYLQASFLILFSWLLLHEEIGIDRVLRVAIGLIGMLLVVRPAFAGGSLGLAYAIGLTQPAISALASVSTKWTYHHGDEVSTTYFWIAVCNFVFSSLLVVSVTPVITLPPLAAIAAIMICGPVGAYLLLWAERLTHLSRLAPLGYFRLVWNVAFGVLVFAEQPTFWTICGIVLILLSCFLPRPAVIFARSRAVTE